MCSCTLWPERRDCDQDCLREIEKTPKDHRVWNIASEWFTGKKCVYCRKPIEAVSHVDHAPALMRIADHRTVEWKDLPPEQLPAAFAECAGLLELLAPRLRNEFSRKRTLRVLGLRK